MTDEKLPPRVRALLEELGKIEPAKPKIAPIKPVPAQRTLPIIAPQRLSLSDLRDMRWEKPSSSTPGKFYTVKYSLYANQWILTCDCPIWIYNKRRNRTCKHTDEVEAEGYPNPFHE